MSTRAQQYDAQVLRRERLSPQLIRLTLGSVGDGVDTGGPYTSPGPDDVTYLSTEGCPDSPSF